MKSRRFMCPKLRKQDNSGSDTTPDGGENQRPLLLDRSPSRRWLTTMSTSSLIRLSALAMIGLTTENELLLWPMKQVVVFDAHRATRPEAIFEVPPTPVTVSRPLKWPL